MKSFHDRSTLHYNNAYNYFAFKHFRGNFLLGARHNKLFEIPVSRHAHVFSINGCPVFHYKYLWLDYIKKINFLKKLYSSNSDLWFITNRYEFLGLLDSFAKNSRANLFHYNARRMFQEGYLGVLETLDFRMKLMGIENTAGFANFHKSKDKYYFLINNDYRDKLFLDELAVEEGYNNEPRLCISPANTNSLYANSFIYALFGNTIPMASKYFFFSLLRRCSGEALVISQDRQFVRSFTKFANFSNGYYFKRSHYLDNAYLSPSHPHMHYRDHGAVVALKVFPDAKIFNIRYNHIHNVFIVKKLYKYFHETREAAHHVNRVWRVSYHARAGKRKSQ